MTDTTTYTATAPDGSHTVTRSSKRTYTHAAWGFGGHYATKSMTTQNYWTFIGFSGSEKNAQKTGNSWRDHYSEIAVTEVVAD